MSVSRFFRDDSGASLVEYLLVVPLLIPLTFGVIDMGMLMWQWNQAAKATHFGARLAIVSTPVAGGINVFNNPDETALVGQTCVDPLTGAQKVYNGVPLCPNRVSVCTSTGCSGGYAATGGTFNAVVNRMTQVLPILEPENVRIAYSSVGLGFLDRPGGSPVAVTVSLTCLGMPLIWLDTFFSAPDGCEGFTGAPIPAFATTLIGEDLADGW